MRVLVTGATGLIGAALVDALLARGHDPVPAVRDVAAARRRWPALEAIAADFARDTDPATWQPRLAGVDAVVNAVGILRESRGQRFDALHVEAPRALFTACARTGVARVVQVSALGADEDARSGYHRSKREADRLLATLPLRATVVRPSLVFAPEGASARLFLALSSLPLLAVPGGGRQRVAPVHLDDLVEAVLRLLEAPQPPAALDVVGPQCLPLRDYLARLRAGLGLGRLRAVALPMPLVRAGARLLGRLPGSLLDADSLAMLERGNCAPADGLAALLGRAPRAADTFVPARHAPALRREARLRWMLPLLRVSIALVWIVTGLLSFGLYPVSESLALLERTGLTGAIARVALYVAATLDLVLGFAMLWPLRRRQLVYLAQIALILGYTAIITVALPEFWSHPYGPVLKNLPLLAALWLLHETDRPA